MPGARWLSPLECMAHCGCFSSQFYNHLKCIIFLLFLLWKILRLREKFEQINKHLYAHYLDPTINILLL